MIRISAALAFLVFFNTESRAADLETLRYFANDFYQKGDCTSAVNAYKQIYYNSDATEGDRDTVIFRTSYCYVQLRQLDAAVTGFQLIVNKYPQQDEARLRLAQTHFQLGQFLLARDEALHVKDPNFLMDAVLLAAQADIELGDPLLAIQELSSVNVNKDWWPTYCYWFGVAYYHNGDSKRAASYFALAINKSPPNLWVIKDARAWLNQLHREQKWIHGSVTFGYFYDGNVAQQSVVGTDANGVALTTGPTPSSYYTDNGFLISTALSVRLVDEKKWNLYSSFGFSSPFYNSYTNYNNQNYSAGLASAFKLSSTWSADLSAKFIDSRYDSVYYQDYLSLLGGLSGPITPKLSFRFELPYTAYMNTRFSKSYGTGMSLHYALPFASVFLGENYSETKGAYATYATSGTSAYLYSGTMFSNYESSGTYAGFNLPFYKQFSVTLQGASTTTNYARENLPLGTYQYSYPNRSDRLLSYTAEVSGPVIPDLWFVSFAYSYYQNKSVGLQGFASSSEISDYNYNRPYWILSSTLGF
jgi:tetratricopeptide (TPR) repeat protein